MKTKWGILGAGGIAEKFVSDLESVPNATVVSVVSKTLEKVERFAEKFSVKKIYTNYEEFAKDDEIDVVYVATTHNFHFEHVKLCLENKKAVLCEKPITVNSKQLLELQALAIKNNVLLMEAMWTYFLPTLQKAKEWIAAGKIGEVNMIKAEFGFKAEIDAQNRVYNANLAGGALLDIGIYPIAFAHFFSKGNVKTIKSILKIGNTNIDEHNSIIIEYESGEIATLNSSVLSSLANDGFIYGSKGYIHLPEFWKGEKATMYAERETIYFEEKRDEWGYNYEAQHISDLLNQHKTESNIVSFEASKAIMQTMDEVRNQNNLIYPFE